MTIKTEWLSNLDKLIEEEENRRAAHSPSNASLHNYDSAWQMVLEALGEIAGWLPHDFSIRMDMPEYWTGLVIPTMQGKLILVDPTDPSDRPYLTGYPPIPITVRKTSNGAGKLRWAIEINRYGVPTTVDSAVLFGTQTVMEAIAAAIVNEREGQGQ